MLASAGQDRAESYETGYLGLEVNEAVESGMKIEC